MESKNEWPSEPDSQNACLTMVSMDEVEMRYDAGDCATGDQVVANVSLATKRVYAHRVPFRAKGVRLPLDVRRDIPSYPSGGYAQNSQGPIRQAWALRSAGNRARRAEHRATGRTVDHINACEIDVSVRFQAGPDAFLCRS